jgi:hypothetical protein
MVKEGQGEEMLPRNFFWAPITAQRFLDLNAIGGTDDYFSSDYSNEELAQRLKHLGSHESLRVLVAFSGSDEYVPSHIDTIELTDRLVSAMNNGCPGGERLVAEGLYLKTGNHNLSEGPDDAKTFVNRISEMLGGME